MKSVALITGITGQDGAYLAKFLLKKGYEVHGLVRRSSSDNKAKLRKFFEKNGLDFKSLHLHSGDLQDEWSITNAVKSSRPTEIYNLAAQSHVGISFEAPIYTANTDGLGTLRFLEAIRQSGEDIKFYQASTSELFGLVQQVPQTEATPFYPRSPYAVAKLYAYWITVNYRESYNMFACNGILFNHESPLRSENFVTRKIVMGLCAISRGSDKPLELGNLSALRDWGNAKDYVEAMWSMLQQKKPKDYVIATGSQYSVREFVELTARELGMEIAWEGTGLEEKGFDISTKEKRLVVKVNEAFFRPSEVQTLLGDPSLARKELGWAPNGDLGVLVKEMVQAELEAQ